MKNIVKLLFTLLLIGNVTAVWAEVRLPVIFGDGMVLQRNEKITVWGWAEPKERISVHFKGKTKETTANADGKWLLKLEREAAGGPYTMEIMGTNKIVFKDVLVGEVWLCSGQSNMAFPVKGVFDAEREIKDAEYPMIRHFSVPRKTAIEPKYNYQQPISWQKSNAENTPEFTAVGFFFAKELYLKLGVPVGIIHASWGGTIIETWMSKSALQKTKGCEKLMENLETLPNEKLLKAKPKNCPTLLFNAMINPLIPYTLNGVIWYQGENNGYWAYQYRNLLVSMVRDWRKNWHNKNLSFYVAQVSSFSSDRLKNDGGTTWAELRESQQCVTKLPHTGIAVTYDLGDSTDIHPRNKQDVGKRLAAIALHQDYGQDTPYRGPVFRKYNIQGNSIEISFDHVDGALRTKEKDEEVIGFELAGRDRVFKPANAKIVENKVIVHHPAVQNPVAVRYAWKDEVSGNNLINESGFPAYPFRTDTFPQSTKNHLLEIVEIN